jgi:hypothetical protein
MALTAEEIQNLRDASLIDFFNGHRDLYVAKATKAYQYAKEYVDAAGEPVRVDDVAGPLVLALKVGDPLIGYLAKKKLTQKYWYNWFADYVLDRLWTEVAK